MSLPVAQGILTEACTTSGMSPEQIRCKARFIKFVRVRQAMMYALKRRTEWSTTQIARFVGIKDHTTVLHGIKKVGAQMANDESLRLLVARLMMAPPTKFYEHSNPFPAPPPEMPRRSILSVNRRTRIGRAKPKRDAMNFVMQGSGRDAIRLNGDGHCRDNARMLQNLRDGSALLAQAILNHRHGIAV